jgi:hypothetical protein
MAVFKALDGTLTYLAKVVDSPLQVSFTPPSRTYLAQILSSMTGNHLSNVYTRWWYCNLWYPQKTT